MNGTTVSKRTMSGVFLNIIEWQKEVFQNDIGSDGNLCCRDTLLDKNDSNRDCNDAFQGDSSTDGNSDFGRDDACQDNSGADRNHDSGANVNHARYCQDNADAKWDGNCARWDDDDPYTKYDDDDDDKWASWKYSNGAH